MAEIGIDITRKRKSITSLLAKRQLGKNIGNRDAARILYSVALNKGEQLPQDVGRFVWPMQPPHFVPYFSDRWSAIHQEEAHDINWEERKEQLTSYCTRIDQVIAYQKETSDHFNNNDAFNELSFDVLGKVPANTLDAIMKHKYQMTTDVPQYYHAQRYALGLDGGLYLPVEIEKMNALEKNSYLDMCHELCDNVARTARNVEYHVIANDEWDSSSDMSAGESQEYLDSLL